MDNAGFYRNEKLKNQYGNKYDTLFLPPYTPDFNPIEKQRANMKRELRGSALVETSLETALYH